MKSDFGNNLQIIIFKKERKNVKDQECVPWKKQYINT